MKNSFSNNIGWKLLSIVFAITLWLYVINVVDPIRSIPFSNLPIEVRNKELITNKDMYVSSLEDITVDVTVEGRRTIVDKLKAGDINVYVDMKDYSEITENVPVKIDNDDESVIYTPNPTKIPVNIEDIDSKEYDIESIIIGELAEGYVLGSEILDPDKIEITGPHSKVAMIDRVYIEIDITDQTDSTTKASIPKVVDSKGNPIPELELSQGLVTISVPVYKYKTVPLSIDIQGEPPEGYKYIEPFSVSNEEVVIKGPEAIIDNIQEIVLDPIVIDTLTESQTFNIDIQDKLPEGVTLYNNNQLSSTNVRVTIEPLLRKDISLPISEINVSYIGEGLQFSFVTTENLILTYEGLADDLAGLDSSDVRVRVYLKDLEVGIHDVTPRIDSIRGLRLIGEMPTIQIELVEEVTEAEVNTDIDNETDAEANNGTDPIANVDTESVALTNLNE